MLRKDGLPKKRSAREHDKVLLGMVIKAVLRQGMSAKQASYRFNVPLFSVYRVVRESRHMHSDVDRICAAIKSELRAKKRIR